MADSVSVEAKVQELLSKLDDAVDLSDWAFDFELREVSAILRPLVEQAMEAERLQATLGESMTPLLSEWGTRPAACGRHEAVHPDTVREVVAALDAVSPRLGDWARQMAWWHAFQGQQAGRLRDDISHAVKCAKEYQTDYPWQEDTASEAVWACGEAAKGSSMACDDWSKRCDAMKAENEHLKSENERLRAELERSQDMVARLRDSFWTISACAKAAEYFADIRDPKTLGQVLAGTWEPAGEKGGA